jgi:DNA-directed RNA polymerase I subunit RPA2
MNTKSKSNLKPNQNEKLLKKIKCQVEDSEIVKGLAQCHIDSFDYAMGEVLKKLPEYIKPLEIKSGPKTKEIFNHMFVSFQDFSLELPVNDSTASLKRSNELFPHECRERELNYSAPLHATIKVKFDSEFPQSIQVNLGNIPVMVRSKFCNLKNKSIDEIVELKEDVHDFGGYFIIHGIEKLIRMTLVSRRNYPIAFV